MASLLREIADTFAPTALNRQYNKIFVIVELNQN